MAQVGKLSQADLDANSAVLLKLVFFSLAMALAPIGTYYSTNWYLFDGNPTYSAIAAVVVANIVLVTYVTIAFREDQRDQAKGNEKGMEKGGGGNEKGRIPGVGKKLD